MKVTDKSSTNKLQKQDESQDRPGSQLSALKFDPAAEKSLREVLGQIDSAKLEIEGQVKKLDSNLDSVLEKNERDFLTAYRFHMLKVQSELMQLKKKANETELKTIQDAKLSELDKEQNRFLGECM